MAAAGEQLLVDGVPPRAQHVLGVAPERAQLLQLPQVPHLRGRQQGGGSGGLPVESGWTRRWQEPGFQLATGRGRGIVQPSEATR